MAGRTLSVTITGDARGAQGAFRDVEGSADTFGTKLQGLGDKLMGFGSKMTLGVSLPLGFLGVQAFNAASDLNESLSKVGVVFGDWAIDIEQFAKHAAENLGISRQAALEAAGTFGNLFAALGLGKDKMTEMSMGLVTLASDLASFNNADPSEVLEALRSGLLGEAEPLRKFGVSLSAARIESKALEMGLGDANDELSAGAKAQAAYAIIMEDTTLAQGDFARTADGAANKQRILNAKFDDAKAKLGQALIPIFQQFADILSKVADWFSQLDPKWQKLITYAGLLLVAIGPLSTVLGGLLTVIGAISLPVLAVALAIGVLIAAGVLLYTKWDEIWNFIKDHPAIAIIIGSVLAPLILIVGGVVIAIKLVKDHWDVIWPAIQAVAERVWGVLKVVFKVMDDAIRLIADAAQWVWDKCQEAWPTIQSIIETAWGVIQPILSFMVDAYNFVKDAIQWLWDKAQEAWPTIQNIIETAWGVVSGPLGLMKDAVDAVMNAIYWIADHAGGAWETVQSVIQTAWNVVSGPLNSMWWAIQKVIDAWHALEGLNPFGGKGDTVPNAKPGAVAGATGGIVRRPTWALIGEAGPEAVIPLDSTPGNRPLSSWGGFASEGRRTEGRRGGNNYAVNVYVAPNANLAEVGRVTVEAIKAFERRSGAGWRAA